MVTKYDSYEFDNDELILYLNEEEVDRINADVLVDKFLWITKEYKQV